MLGLIYLLHFERPISEAHRAQHYIGWALDLPARLALHRAGRGARLTQVAVARGIDFEVVRIWEGTRDFERQLKNGKRGPRLCPICCQIHGRHCAATRATQLPLPLDADEDFPAAPRRRMDYYELAHLRGYRLARAALLPAPNLMEVDACL